MRAEPLEAGELRLDRDARLTGRLDQVAAVFEDGRSRPLRDVAQVRVGSRVRRQRGRVRIKPQAYLAPALLDERRQPVGENRVSRP
jgi:hypothetical protein